MQPRYAIPLVLVFLITPIFFLQAQTANEIRGQISNRNAQIEELNKEIASYEKQLTTIGEQKQTLQSTLNTLDISRRQITAKINVTKNNIASIQQEIEALTGDIANKEVSITKDTKALAQAINRMNEVENATFVEQILGSASVSDLWDEMESSRVFQDAVQDHILTLTEAKQVLTEDKEASEKKHTELEGQRRRLAAEQQTLDITRREQQSLLTQTKSQESNYQKLLEEKKTAKIQFEQALNELESKLEYSLDPSRIPAAGKGILRWPLDKVTITQYFGNTSFAKSGAYSGKGHNGLDFRASIGTPVKAALTGTVEGSGNSDLVRGCYSYGKWVLIKHGNGLTTLYAHLSQQNVSPGQEVTTGEIIGYSGNTGYATGPHLHFTVYASNGVKVMKLGQSTGRSSPCANATIPVSPLGAYLNPMEYL